MAPHISEAARPLSLISSYVRLVVTVETTLELCKALEPCAMFSADTLPSFVIGGINIMTFSVRGKLTHARGETVRRSNTYRWRRNIFPETPSLATLGSFACVYLATSSTRQFSPGTNPMSRARESYCQ